MTGKPVEIVVLGAFGRMGRMILETCAREKKAGRNLTVIGAVEAPRSSEAASPGRAAGFDLPVTDSLPQALKPGCSVIDFTAPAATLKNLEAAQAAGAGVVIGTTGFDEAGKRAIADFARHIPIVFSPNMSIGVNLLFKVAEMVAGALDAGYDIEIVEAHHNQKKDAPSGTALGLAESVARGRRIALKDWASFGREGLTGARKTGEIGIHAVRGGDIVGDHTVLFAGPGERIELKHVAHSRQTFAEGAVKAALFLHGKPAGLYSMADVLGLG